MEIKIQEGDTFVFPSYLKPIIKENYITFKKQPFFKNGDILIMDEYIDSAKCKTMFIYNGEKDRNGFYHYHILRNNDGQLLTDGKIFADSSQFRHATIYEEYPFFEQLKKGNLKWNKEDCRIEHVIWRANKNENYYYINTRMEVVQMTDKHTLYDNQLYESENYFRTKNLAHVALLELKSTLRKYHEDIKE